MSASIPYVAPWQSGFDRYSTQLYPIPALTATASKIVIPDGQWWRIVYVNTSWATSAAAANRTLELDVLDRAGVVKFVVQTPLVQIASTIGNYLFAPNAMPTTNTSQALNEFGSMTIPDMLWPPGFQIEVRLLGAQANDGISQQNQIAVEIYTESERPGVLQPSPSPLVP